MNARFVATMAFAGLASLAARAAPAPVAARPYVLKAGQEITFTVTVADGHVALGPPRLSRLGTATPASGEITVGLTPRDKDLYSNIVAIEKTSVPIDFVATGLIGEIKIDERILCGRLDAPATVHIGGVSWSVALKEFEVGKGGETCE